MRAAHVWIIEYPNGARAVYDEPRPGAVEYVAEDCVEHCSHCARRRVMLQRLDGPAELIFIDGRSCMHEVEPGAMGVCGPVDPQHPRDWVELRLSHIDGGWRRFRETSRRCVAEGGNPYP